MSIEVQNISKSYGAQKALDNVSFSVKKGEIVGFLGPNGAGKSTLMKILTTFLNADEGLATVNGNDVTENQKAVQLSIGYLPEHNPMYLDLYIREYLAFNADVYKVSKSRIEEVIQLTGLSPESHKKIGQLSKGYRQRVGLATALLHNPDVLILDEPTAVLTPQETDELLKTMQELKRKGTSIIFITHKLREVRAVADQITIIRRGKVVSAVSPTTSEGELASMMVGRAVDLAPEKHKHVIGNPILVAKDLTVRDAQGTAVVKAVNFHVNASEVLAIAGVQGNGQSELARALVNLEDHIEGSISLDGKEIRGSSIYDSLHAGIAFIPESRELDGLVSSFSIAENLILDLHDQAPYAKGLNLSGNIVLSEAEKRVAEFDIRLQSVNDAVSTLSGGNKQKVVIARELSRPVKVLVASQPTRGLDVGSIEFVHERILAERDQGRGVILFSTELDEVMALADRIAVMYRGEILEIVDSGVTREELGLLMAGVVNKKASA